MLNLDSSGLGSYLESASGIILTAATILLLSFAAQNTLSPLFSPGNAEKGVFEFQIIGESPSESVTTGHDLWIKALLVDGRRLRWESVEYTGDCKVVDLWRSGDPILICAQSSKPAKVAFEGRNVVAVFQANDWFGVVNTERNKRKVHTLNFRDASVQLHPIVFENPVTPPSKTAFWGVCILCVLGALIFGPVRANRRSLHWLVFFLLSYHMLFWAGQYVGTTSDSAGYLDSAANISRGWPGYFPPGYPAFIGIVASVSGEVLGRWATFVQHGLTAIAGVWVFLILRRMMPDRIALAGGILAGALPSNLTMSQNIMSETPTLFAMVGALYFAIRSSETRKPLFAILSGALAGCAGVLRVTPLPALIPAFCAVHLLPRPKRGWRPLAVTIAVTIVVVLTPVLWFGFRSGEFILANSTGAHLFDRTVNEQKLLDEKGPATKTLLSLLNGKDPRGMPFWEIRDQPGVRHLDYSQVMNLLQKVSLEAIRRNPFKFLIFTFPLTWNNFTADSVYWIASWGVTESLYPDLETPPPLRPTASGFEWRSMLEKAHSTLWPILCWASIAGALIGLFLPQRVLIISLAWIPFGYLFSAALVECLIGRMNIAIVPFVAALALVPFGAFLSYIRRHSRGSADQGSRAVLPGRSNLR